MRVLESRAHRAASWRSIRRASEFGPRGPGADDVANRNQVVTLSTPLVYIPRQQPFRFGHCSFQSKVLQGDEMLRGRRYKRVSCLSDRRAVDRRGVLYCSFV